MKNIIFTITCILILALIPKGSKAQSFGYQGKKLILSGNFSISPNITNFNASEKQNVNTNFGISAEYALFKKASVGFKFSNFKTTVTNLDEIKRSYFGTEYRFLPQEFVPLNVNQKEIYIRNYYKHNSPLGMYFGLSIGQHTSNIRGNEINYQYQPSYFGQNSPVNEVDVSYSEKFSFIYFGIEHGVQRIVYDRITLNFGATLRYSNDLIGFNISGPNDIELTEGQRVHQLSKKRVAAHAFFRLKFGIGYLIF